jgi:uncharacterized protein (TIGR02001 family)
MIGPNRAALILVASFGAAPMLAADRTVSAGVSFTTDYVSDGITQSNNKFAIQPHAEVEQRGYYAGVWASNVDFGTSDDIEVDLTLGYRHELPSGLAYDLSYSRYWYNGSGDCCGSLDLSLGLPVTPQLGLGTDLSWDPEAKTSSVSVSGDYALSDKLGLSATFGHSDANVNTFWSAGASYALTDQVTLGAEYHDTSTTESIVLLNLSFDTEFTGN